MHRMVGHSPIQDFFSKVIKHGAISHAYRFVGPEHVGKCTFAEALAAQLLETDRDELHRHPDVLTVTRGIDEKTGSLKKDISIDQMREVIHFFGQFATRPNGYKIAIIDQAHLMSQSAGNALLKTLEEPRGNSLILLITHDEIALLPTIRSRTQRILFGLLAHDEIRDALMRSGASAETAERYAEEVNGKIGTAYTWLENSDTYEEHRNEQKRFRGLLTKPWFEKCALVEPLFGDKKDHIRARDELLSALAVWRQELRTLLCRAASNRAVLKTLLKAEQELSRAERLMNQNIHPRLLVEHILLSLP